MYDTRKGDLLVLSWASVHLIFLGKEDSDGCISGEVVLVILFGVSDVR